MNQNQKSIGFQTTLRPYLRIYQWSEIHKHWQEERKESDTVCLIPNVMHNRAIDITAVKLLSPI